MFEGRAALCHVKLSHGCMNVMKSSIHQEMIRVGNETSETTISLKKVNQAHQKSIEPHYTGDIH